RHRVERLLDLPAHCGEQLLPRDEPEHDRGFAETNGRARDDVGALLHLLRGEVSLSEQDLSEPLARDVRARADHVALIHARCAFAWCEAPIVTAPRSGSR